VAPVSFKPEDQVLVQIAIEECKRSRLEKYAPKGLIWTAKIQPDQVVLSGDYLRLPQVLNGKLQPEEWRPLIASGIVQQEMVKQRKRSPSRRDLPWIVVGLTGVFGSITLIGLLPMIYGISHDRLWPLGLTFWIFLIVPGQLAGLSRIRNIRLDSDIQAKDEPSVDALLKTLTKIQSLDVCRPRNRIRTGLSYWPNLSQRIRNLEKWQTAP
jgi:hypothetical protein